MGVLSHGLQGVHNVWLVSLAIEFLLHLGHSIVPALAEARPGGHSMQFTEPAAFAYDPGRHGVRPWPEPLQAKPGSHCTEIPFLA